CHVLLGDLFDLGWALLPLFRWSVERVTQHAQRTLRRVRTHPVALAAILDQEQLGRTPVCVGILARPLRFDLTCLRHESLLVGTPPTSAAVGHAETRAED